MMTDSANLPIVMFVKTKTQKARINLMALQVLAHCSIGLEKDADWQKG